MIRQWLILKTFFFCNDEMKDFKLVDARQWLHRFAMEKNFSEFLSRMIWATLTLLAVSLLNFPTFGCDVGSITKKYDLFSNGLCLRGADMFQQEKYSTKDQIWNPNIDQRDLDNLRNAGANFVNYSVPGTYDVRTYLPRADFKQKLDAIIEQAVEADLFIIISFRTGPGRGEGNITEDGLSNCELYTNAAARSAFIQMWKDVATTYKNNSNVIGYDILVEPNGVSRNEWRRLAQKVIDGIREVDCNTPILVAPDDWGGVDSLNDWEPLNGNFLVYTVHQYEPYSYTHNNKPTDWSSVLKRMYLEITEWVSHYNENIIINEFGIKNSVYDAGSFMKEQINLLESRKVNHAAWIWEVEYDSDYTDRDFDFKRESRIYSSIQATWKKNTVFASSLKFSNGSTREVKRDKSDNVIEKKP